MEYGHFEFLFTSRSQNTLVLGLETWAVVYFVTGTLSLFGDLISSRTVDWGALNSVRTTAER